MLRDTPMSVNEAQSYVDNGGPYKLEGLDTLPAELNTPEKFIKEFFRRLNSKHNTVTLKGTLVCGTQRLRTVVDLSRLCNHYFPGTNVVQVRQIFFDLASEKYITGSICHGIKQRVFGYSAGGGSTSDRDNRDEFGWKFNKRQRREPGEEKAKTAPKAMVKSKLTAPKRKSV